MPHTPDHPHPHARPTLIIGASGMLGRALVAVFSSEQRAFISPTREHLDMLRPETLQALVPDCSVVINAAAWTDVDAAESNEPAAGAINADAVGRLADLCRIRSSTLVHFSTDHVFSGIATAPVPIGTPLQPANAYGRTKAEGERLIAAEMARGLRALILRTSWLYAPWGRNFVRTVAAEARSRPSLRVVDDQRGRPTSAEHLANATVRLLDRGTTGVLHVTDGGACTRFELAARIAARVNRTCTVLPCTSAEYPRPGNRPAYSVLDLGPTERVIGPMPHWTVNLDGVLQRLES